MKKPAWILNFTRFRKVGAKSHEALLAAFTHTPLAEVEDHRLALGEKTHTSLRLFRGSPKAFFYSTPTIEEFYHSLRCNFSKMPARQAWLEAHIRQSKSEYYNRFTVNEFTLNSWSRFAAKQVAGEFFKREVHRPTNDDLQNGIENHLTGVFARGIKYNEEIASPVVNVLWGGHKEGEDYTAEDAMLAKFRAIKDKLTSKGIKLRIRVLQSDVHSALINGVSEREINAYGKIMQEKAKEHGLEFKRLSDIYAQHGLVVEHRSDKLESKPTGVPEDARSWIGGLEYTRVKLKPSPMKASIDFIIAGVNAEHGLDEGADGQAEKRSRKVASGTLSARQGSRLYRFVRGLEAKLFNEKYPDELFATFADPNKARKLNPDNTLFLWNGKRGNGATPWFGGKHHE